MKLEAMRMLKAGLADATNGINAKIAGLTIDTGDVRPTNPTRYFDVDDPWVARRQLNAEDTDVTLPALAVFAVGPLDVGDAEVMTVVRDVEIKIGLAYLLKTQDSDEIHRAGLYFNRALLRWFTWFMRNEQSSAFRTKNDVIIRRVDGIIQDDKPEIWEAAVSIAQTVATFTLRENSP